MKTACLPAKLFLLLASLTMAHCSLLVGDYSANSPEDAMIADADDAGSESPGDELGSDVESTSDEGFVPEDGGRVCLKDQKIDAAYVILTDSCNFLWVISGSNYWKLRPLGATYSLEKYGTINELWDGIQSSEACPLPWDNGGVDGVYYKDASTPTMVVISGNCFWEFSNGVWTGGNLLQTAAPPWDTCPNCQGKALVVEGQRIDAAYSYHREHYYIKDGLFWLWYSDGRGWTCGPLINIWANILGTGCYYDPWSDDGVDATFVYCNQIFIIKDDCYWVSPLGGVNSWTSGTLQGLWGDICYPP